MTDQPAERMATDWMDVGDEVAPKIDSITLNTPRTRQSLVKGERLVRHGMGAVLQWVGLQNNPLTLPKLTDGVTMERGSFMTK